MKIVEKIKHNCWVYKKVNNIQYRGSFIDEGITFSGFILQKQNIFKLKIFLFFGKKIHIPIWKTIKKTKYAGFSRQKFYEVFQIESLFNKHIKEYEEENIVFIHKKYIENQHQKRERIINKISK